MSKIIKFPKNTVQEEYDADAVIILDAAKVMEDFAKDFAEKGLGDIPIARLNNFIRSVKKGTKAYARFVANPIVIREMGPSALNGCVRGW